MKECPMCGEKLQKQEFQSMGPGYSEWKHHNQGEIIYHCKHCKKDFQPGYHTTKLKEVEI